MEKPNLRGKKIPDKIHSWSPSSVIHRKKFQTKFPSGLLSYTVKKFQTKFTRGPVESVWMQRLVLYGWYRIFSYIHPIRRIHNRPK